MDLEKQQVIRKMLREYYKTYYLDTLKLYDWEERYNSIRIHEEEVIGKKVIDMLVKCEVHLEGKSVLVAGAGTGAELFYLHNSISEVNAYAIEPYVDAFKILQRKAELYSLPAERLKQSKLECLPFDDGMFDVVICFTVLEHVDDIRKSIHEIYRVLKSGGNALLETPNYYYPEEQHYKSYTFPPKLSKTLARLVLKARGRYSEFFESLNFISNSDIDKVLYELNASYIRLDKYTKISGGKNFVTYLVWFYSILFKIPRNQVILVSK